MNHEFQRVCGLYGRTLQLLANVRIALQTANAAQKKQIAEYESCLRYEGQKSDMYHEWAIAAQKEKDHWRNRALAAEKENFELKINQP